MRKPWVSATLIFLMTAPIFASPETHTGGAVPAGAAVTLSGAAPIVIAHRGASGYRPEHTLEAYRLAIEMGADFIEPDLVSTRDGRLVARHEPNITATTDVASRPEFAKRRTTKQIDGVDENGWFTTDFTLAELRTLRAVQPRAERSREFDGRFGIPTLDEIITLARSESKARGREIGIYPETKHPTWHCEQNLPLEPGLLEALARAGWTERRSPVFIQSFEAGNLAYLRTRTGVRLVQLIDANGLTPEGAVLPPRAWSSRGSCKLYPKGELPADLSDPVSFRRISRYADAVGPWKRYLIPSRAAPAELPGADPNAEAGRRTMAATNFVALAHAAGLAVHPWTFRNESQYLAADYNHDPLAEYRAFYALGIDGLFSDFPDTAIAALTSSDR